MREIKQGTLYGFDLVLKVPEDHPEDEVINQYTLEKHVERGKNRAVEGYKSEQFLKLLNNEKGNG